jgi:predicted component of type VI protein secretion system
MKKSLAPMFCLLLAGCTDADWDHALNYGSTADETPAAPSQPKSQPQTQAASEAPPAQPANADFCRGVAAQDATHNDFDPATQTHVFARSYAQCLALYTR